MRGRGISGVTASGGAFKGVLIWFVLDLWSVV